MFRLFTSLLFLLVFGCSNNSTELSIVNFSVDSQTIIPEKGPGSDGLGHSNGAINGSMGGGGGPKEGQATGLYYSSFNLTSGKSLDPSIEYIETVFVQDDCYVLYPESSGDEIRHNFIMYYDNTGFPHLPDELIVEYSIVNSIPTSGSRVVGKGQPIEVEFITTEFGAGNEPIEIHLRLFENGSSLLKHYYYYIFID